MGAVPMLLGDTHADSTRLLALLETPMDLVLNPLPVKNRISFDIPKLIEIMQKEKRFVTDASFDDLLTVRNYLIRHPELKLRLAQRKIEGGYILQLRYRHDKA
jgi:hypothetical protein